MRFWKPGDIFETRCPKCGGEVEFFKDEVRRKCGCGHEIVNPKMDLGCAIWCQYAEQCLGVYSLKTWRPSSGQNKGETRDQATRAKLVIVRIGSLLGNVEWISSLGLLHLSLNSLHLKWKVSLFFVKKRILSLFLYIQTEWWTSSVGSAIKNMEPNLGKFPMGLRPIRVSGSPHCLRNSVWSMPANIKWWCTTMRLGLDFQRFEARHKVGITVSSK